ncbi:hypothetical protein GGS20DRAFT_553430 [Poronia punctata]|nr:hypothetical protein GGS20DRAFT_553430 [Poronia punctata]
MAPPSYRAYGSTSPGIYAQGHGQYGHGHHDSGASIWDDIMASSREIFKRARGRHSAWHMLVRAGQQLRRNMVRRRLVSFPHLLVGIWVLVLLWGERWTFASKVNSCDWDHWEDWPAGATPHRLVFVADPQLIDPHSYPGRPWPLNPLTMRITDNYMRRSYKQLQRVLHPDTVIFLGDLFDGGREWKTAHGDFEEPDWAKENRPDDEKKLLDKWHRRYGEQYWLKEYARFGRIFADNWILGGTVAGPYQRGRKLIASLPGNHDLGFGAEVKVPVRQRFIAYFGETNRVDVIGNHTFVSVDGVSLSADTSRMKDYVDLHEIYAPVNEFLDEVKATKRRAVQKELRFWRGEVDEVSQRHSVEELESANFDNLPTLDPGENAPDFPTILLSHVPLYRDPGTPCGPLREHWPPAKPPKGQTDPVIPDHRNAIEVSAGYQYQNVLSEEDSVKLIKSIGNVKHAFSGDDHDYCELIHSPAKENVHEITVKSFSMVMGVSRPGFQMVSLYNPIDGQGRPLPGSPPSTLQSHLCLLPNQLSMYVTYAILGVLTALILVARAFLLPVLDLQPFSLEPMQNAPSAILPVFKDKSDAYDDGYFDPDSTTSSATSASKSNLPSARFSSSTRTRTTTPQYNNNKSKVGGGGSGGGGGKWGWGQNNNNNNSSSSKGPRIQIRRDTYYYNDDGKTRGGNNNNSNNNGWKPARQRNGLGLVLAEIWTTCWRVAWMVLLFYSWLMYRG